MTPAPESAVHGARAVSDVGDARPEAAADGVVRARAGLPGRAEARLCAPAVQNHAAFWGAPRAPLTLAFSSDGGRTWPVRHDLESGDGYCLSNDSRNGLNRELPYPTIALTPDGALHIAYTRHRRTIAHVRLSPDRLASHTR
ncbi:hypothetical protein [Streptomyces sp. NPDC048473]|uniref:hypothetical protein n=1 Tax=unclassified Streptomyces TaxID=2593676 RepID=UPI00371CD944